MFNFRLHEKNTVFFNEVGPPAKFKLFLILFWVLTSLLAAGNWHKTPTSVSLPSKETPRVFGLRVIQNIAQDMR